MSLKFTPSDPAFPFRVDGRPRMKASEALYRAEGEMSFFNSA